MSSEDYVQVRTPDKVEIAHLVNRAKGNERTMAQFAEVCQISASTLSRIVNGKITKPLSYNTVLKIYNGRAFEEDKFLFDMLISANGMNKKGIHEGQPSKFPIYTRRNQILSRETTMKNIVVTELFDRGIPVVHATRLGYGMDENTTAYEIFPGRIGDMAVTLNDQAPSESVWAFYWFPQEPEFDTNREISPKKLVRRTIDIISRLLLVDAWQPEIIKGLKTSFVFSNREVFECFFVTLKDAKLNTEMSAILLDISEGCVIEERWLPGLLAGGDSIFSRKKILEVQKAEEEFDYLNIID